MSGPFSPRDRVNVQVGKNWNGTPILEPGTVEIVQPDKANTFMSVYLDSGRRVWTVGDACWHLRDCPAHVAKKEIQEALRGNTAPAANADEFEAHMLNLLADQDKRHKEATPT